MLSASGEIIRCAREGQSAFKSEADRRAWIAAGLAVYQPYAGQLTYEHFQGAVVTLAGTPADQPPITPARIGQILQGLKCNGAGSILENVHELLGSTVVAPAASAAIFRYLATVPGLTVVADARTHDGRVGVAISVAGNGLTGSQRWVTRFLIFDPATSALIGYRELAPGASATQVGHERAWEDYIARGPVALNTGGPPPNGVEGLSGDAARKACSPLTRPWAGLRRGRRVGRREGNSADAVCRRLSPSASASVALSRSND